MNLESNRPTGDELWLAGVAALAALLVVPVIIVAGNFSFWMAPAALLAAAAVFFRTDSPHGLAALGILAVMWVASAPGDLSPWSIAIALLMFTIHASLALRTTAPPGAKLGRPVLVRWLRRSAAIAVLTALVYLLALSLQNLHHSDAEIVLAAALALLGGLVLLLRRETLDARG